MSTATTITRALRRSLTVGLVPALVAAHVVWSPLGGSSADGQEPPPQDGPEITLSKQMPAETLYGDTTDIVLTATNPPGGAGGDTFNASFRDVLAPGVMLDTSDPVPTQTLPQGDGSTVLIWENIGDLQDGASVTLSYTISHDPGTWSVGDTIPNDASVYTNTDARLVPDFDPETGAAVDDYNSNASANASTVLLPFELTKSEPSTEDELLRGVHDHQTVYTLEIRNNFVLSTSDVAVEDWLPAGIEFLGCGGVDNTTTGDEYPGSGPVNPGNAPALTEPCPTPSTVETVTTDPDGAGPLPEAVYTHVAWTVADLGAGSLAPGATFTFQYVAAIPLRANVEFPPGTDTGGLQTANLDNNAGPLTADEQGLTNLAVAAGTTGGVTATDSDTEQVVAEDVSIHKSVTPDTLGQGQSNTWTLLVETSEYATASGPVTVTDTVPDGLSVTGTNPTADSVVENTETGEWTVTWNLPNVPAPSGETTLTITTVGDDTYTARGDVPAERPLSTNDTVTNTVSLTAPTVTTIVDETGATDTVSATDESEATITAGGIDLVKHVAQPAPFGTAVDCFDGTPETWVDVGEDYTVGDRVCWRVAVDFPSALDTPDLAIQDYLPNGYVFEGWQYGPGNTLAGETFTDEGAYQQWTYGDVTTGGQRFEVIVSSILSDPDAVDSGDLTANLAKLTHENIDNTVFQLRDEADAVAARPEVSLVKQVLDVDDDATGFPADSAQVQGGDVVTFGVTVTNDGTRDAESTEVWDLLPAETDCSTVSAIDSGGTCNATEDRIEWTGLTVPAEGSITLTYDVTVPDDIDPARTMTNTAGVRGFEATTNTTDSPFEYVPRENIDPTREPEANTDPADDDASLTIPAVEVSKTRTTSISEAGNAASNQATIGEIVSYTVEVTIPEGTTLDGPVTLTDTVTDRLTIVGTPTYTLDGGPTSNASVAGQTISVELAPAGDSYVNAAGSGDDLLVLTFDARVDDEASNTRTGATIPNVAAFTYTDRDGATVTRTDSITTQVVEPNVAVSKDEDDADDVVGPGDELTYSVTASNETGTRVSTAHDFIIVDTIPEQLIPLDGSGGTELADGEAVASGGIWDASARTITWTTAQNGALASIVPGASVTVDYHVRVADPLVGSSTLTNEVSLEATSLAGSDPNERDADSPGAGDNYDATTTDTVSAVELEIVKVVDPTQATIGETVTFTLDVTIPGGTIVYDTTVLDTLPAGFTYLETTSTACAEGTDPCTPDVTVDDLGADGQTVGWFLGDLATASPEDRVVTISYTAYVDTDASDGDVLTNSATVYGNQTDKVTGTPAITDVDPTTYDNDAGPATADVDVDEPSLTIDKDVDGQVGDSDTRRAVPGEPLTFSLVVRNDGNETAYDAVVADTPDDRLLLGTVADGTGYTVTDADPSDGTLAWAIPTLAPGESVTITYELDVPAGWDSDQENPTGPELTNTADVTSYFGLPEADRVAGRFVEYDDVTPDTVDIELDLASIGDRVWFDVDGDGVQDGGDEYGFTGVTVEVTYLGPDGVLGGGDDEVVTTVTGADGIWLVEDLPGGQYLVDVDESTLPGGAASGLSVTYDLDDGTSAPDGSWTGALGEDEDKRDVDTGFNGDGSLGDLVWLDVDADGGFDPATETGIPAVDVVVTWFGPDGVPGGGDDVAWTVTTDADGGWTAPDLPAGNYSVDVDEATLPPGITITYDLDDGTTAPDGTWTGALGAGEDKDDVDTGYVGAGTIGDTVWLDLDGDGTQDAGEPGIPEVDVTLVFGGADGDLDTTGDNLTLTTTTGPDGTYDFTGLPDGPYRVEVDAADLPADLVPTADFDGVATPHVSETTLSDGARDDDDQDFGYQGPGSIGDLVWLDLDGDGTQDAGEPGLPGVDVTVTYLGPDGVPGGGDDVTITTTTDADGGYSVEGLPTGNYQVTVDTATLPSGLAPTADADGTGTPHTSAVTLTTGEPSSDVQDFGYQGAGSIGDLVWLDRDGDGVQDPPDGEGNGGEPGLPDVDVTVTHLGDDGVLGGGDDLVFELTTDADGLYGLSGLPDGDYVVQVDETTLPDGVTQTFDASGAQDDGTSEVSLVDGARDRLDQDFGYSGSAALGDLVWLDTDEDGVVDADEAGIPGVVLTIVFAGADGVAGNGDDLSFQVTTDADGAYDLSGLPAGSYTVTVTGAVPAALEATFDEDSGTTDPDATTVVELSTGEDHDTADFGFAGDTSLGDRVWWDLDADGVQGPDEPGLNGVTVQLTAPGVDGVLGTGDDITTTTVTDGDGDYLFTNLSEGPHLVEVVDGVQAGFAPTYDLDSGTTAPDEQSERQLAEDEVALDVDFGYVGDASLGDTVWLDLDGDGTQDPDEPGIGDVTVTLTWLGPDGEPGGGDDVSLVTTTGPDGTYGFDGLPDGTYVVDVDPTTLPDGVDPTYDVEGEPDGSATVQIEGQVSRADVDYGYQGTAEVGDTVWLDLDGDGVLDDGEPGIPAVDVTVTHAGADGAFGTDDDLVITTTTAGDGTYGVSGLPAGEVQVVLDPADLPPGTTSTADPDGGDDDRSQTSLDAGESDLDQDFAYVGGGSIGDQLWLDLDGDGEVDEGEPGLPGIPVTVTWYGPDGDPGTDDDIVIEVLTGPDGTYLVPGLPEGTFSVDVDESVLPDGVTQTGDPDDVLDGQSAVTLGPDEDNLDQDFGWQGAGTLGDLVWYDTDQDGVFDPGGEFGFAGVDVTVTLVGSDGELGTDDDVAVTTTTDADGAWQVTGLPAGDFVVTVDTGDLPGEVVPTFDADGGDDSRSDVTLPVEGTDLDQDFGYVGTLAIGDTLYFDVDADGSQDDGEPGLGGVVVQLWNGDLLVAETVTADDGTYLFEDLVPGDWTVVVDPATLPSGLEPTVDADGIADTPNRSTTTLTDADDLDQDFGYRGTSSLGDLVFDDLDADGVQDAAEPGVSGVVVELYLADDLDTPIATTETAADGTYLFPNLRPGDYVVVVVPPEGTAITPAQDAGGDDALDSDVDPTTGATGPVTVPANTDVDTVDAGLVTLGSIGDLVFDDRDGDGVQDPGEPGLSGIEVRLLVDGEVVATTTTDVDGRYLFDGLLPGTYMVEVVVPDGARATGQDVGADDALDSDISPATGRTGPIELASGQDRVDVDAGVRLTSELAVTKTLDGDLVLGELVTYVIEVTVLGPFPAPGPITLIDELPDELAYAGATGDGWQCAADGQTVTCVHDGPIEVDASSTVRLDVRVALNRGNAVSNQVSVLAAGVIQPGGGDQVVAGSPPASILAEPDPGPLPITGGEAARLLLLSLLLVALGGTSVLLARDRPD